MMFKKIEQILAKKINVYKSPKIHLDLFYELWINPRSYFRKKNSNQKAPNICFKKISENKNKILWKKILKVIVEEMLKIFF